jgi:RNA polymerase sigma factor (sigma-70 family)
MEVSALKPTALVMRGPPPLLRLQSDERLVVLTRRGNQAAYEALVGRYQSRLHAFCRHMLGSKEDAEDVLQDVFAAAFNAMLADERPINVRPWLYRIARNRSLNHMRRRQAIGVDSMDVHLADGGETTADKVHRREEFRLLMGDVRELPETQRTALLLREIDALSYEQIAEAMETTVPSVKSLLVRARVSLAEMAESRKLTCDEVRLELGEVAEGLKRISPPVRRHLRTCDRCGAFREQLRSTNKALASILPVGPLFFLKKFLFAQLGTTASAGGASAAGGAGAGAGSLAAAGASTAAGGALSTTVTAVATKAATGLAAAAIVTAGAVEVDHATRHHVRPKSAVAVVASVRRPQPVIAVAPPAPVAHPAPPALPDTTTTATAKSKPDTTKTQTAPVPPAATTPVVTTPAPPTTTTTPATTTTPTTTQEGADTTVLPNGSETVQSGAPVESVPPQQQTTTSQQQASPPPADQPAPGDSSPTPVPPQP